MSGMGTRVKQNDSIKTTNNNMGDNSNSFKPHQQQKMKTQESHQGGGGGGGSSKQQPFHNHPQGTLNNGGRRRKQVGQHQQHHQRSALASIDDMESVQLEQAVRELNCFEEILATPSAAPAQDRKFALEYLEGIVARWCQNVQEQGLQKANAAAALASQQQQQQPQQQPKDSKPSFASIAAGNSNSSTSNKSFAQAVAGSKPNVWQRAPPASVMGGTETTAAFISSTVTAALIPFGSYRLGVHSTESDFDLLALAPPHVHRSDFFTSLVKILRDDPRCQQVHPIPSAYTPVIKFELDCHRNTSNEPLDQQQRTTPLQIDLLFARVADATKLIEYHKQKIQQKKSGDGKEPAKVEYHLDDTDLQDLDEAGVRSLNGARVSQMILEYVPDVPKFQIVLCAVKRWAVVHGIYSNVLGFLGGVNWAITTAYICKQFPDLDAASTLRVFFRTFATWQWNRPVMLLPTVADVPPITNVSKQTRAVYLPAWNPDTNPRDGLHIMPIITPAYPSMNSSYNVDMPQLRRIQEELIRVSNMLQQRNQRRHRKSFNGNIYRELFGPADFFGRHRHFLRIDVSAATEQDFVEWFRLVESRLRVLISNLDTPQVHAFPFAQFFSVPITDPLAVPNALQKCFFIGLRFAEGVNEVNVKHLTLDFLHKVNSWEGRKAGMDLNLRHVLDDGIPVHVWEVMRRRNNKNHPQKKDSSERSVDSENTAPATDDEDDDNSSYGAALNNSKQGQQQQQQPSLSSSPDLTSPHKKCRVVDHKTSTPPQQQQESPQRELAAAGTR